MDAANSEAFSRPKAKSDGGPFSRQGDEGLGGFSRVVDDVMAGDEERGASADDDEEDDYHAADAAEKHVQAGLRVLARGNPLFHEARLQ